MSRLRQVYSVTLVVKDNDDVTIASGVLCNFGCEG